MNRFSRRSFVQRMGVGLGVVGSIAHSLVARADGVPPPRRVVFVVWSNGVPESVISASSTGALTTLPAALAPLANHRQKMLVLDNLTNRVNFEHSTGYGALAAVEGSGDPGGITIDQHLAQHLGSRSVIRSLNWGIGDIYSWQKPLQAVIFARGPHQPLPHVLQQDGLFRQVFTNTEPAAFSQASQRRHLVLQPLRAQIRKLAAQLAPTERRTLDHYEAALEEYDTRLSTVPAPVTACGGGSVSAPPAGTPGAEVQFESMSAMSTLALSCGLTNVIGISVSAGYGHSGRLWPRLGMQNPTLATSGGELEYWGHDPNNYAPAMTKIIAYVASQVARMVDAWSAIPDGNGTLMDNTTIVMLSDSGGTTNGHHRVFNKGWPVVIIGNAGGALRADGRSVRFADESAHLGGLWSTIATASGVPTERFGKTDGPPNTPLTALLT